MRRRNLLVGLLLSALAAAVAAVALRVPPGRVAVGSDGRRAAWRMPGTRLVTVKDRDRGTLDVTSAEGARRSLEWSAEWDLAGASADALAEAAERGMRAVVADAIASAAPRGAWTTASLQAAAAQAGAALERRGIVTALSVTSRHAVAEEAPRPLDGRSRRVLLVGVDGMDWQIADPLLRAGRMPHLKALVARGHRAPLRSMEPMLSPLVWTTIATGRRPEDHGVGDFLAIDPASGRRLPITSGFRRVPALWNMASAARLDVAFVGWWATWPAEPVQGVMVSDRLAYALRDVEAPPPERVAFPPSARERALALRVRPEDVDDALLARFARGRADDARVTQLRRMLAQALTYHAVAKDALAARPQLASVYYELVDEACHLFMDHAPPRRPGVSAEDFAAFSHAVDAAYEAQDAWLGELTALVPDDTVVVLVSDHGFLSGDARPPGSADVLGQPALWHRREGVIVVAGADVDAGAFASASVLDVAPTVLDLLGLPAGRDMPGRSLLGDVRRIETWDAHAPVMPRPPARSDEALDAAAVEALAALGYVGAQPPPGASPAPAPERHVDATSGLATTASYHLNMATSLMDAGRLDDAAREARESLDRAPTAGAWRLLSRIAERAGDMKRAAEAARQAASLPDATGEDRVAADELAARAGLPAGATPLSQALAAIAGGDASGLPGVLAAFEEHPESERLLRLALPLAPPDRLIPILRAGLARNPSLPGHHEALGALLLSSGDARAAAAELRACLALVPGNDVARARLALALVASGDATGASREADAVVAAAPREADAWALLAAVHGRLGRPGDVLRDVAQARARGPSSASLDASEVVALAQSGDADAARAALEAARARHPDDATLAEIAASLR